MHTDCVAIDSPVSDGFEKNEVIEHPRPAISFGQSSELIDAVRTLCRYEQERNRTFDPSLFANPLWDIFLDAFLASVRGEILSVKAACLAADLPKSTALRHLDHLCDAGLLHRSPHPFDSRSNHVAVSNSGFDCMSTFLLKSKIRVL
jgi:hypothetical protein